MDLLIFPLCFDLRDQSSNRVPSLLQLVHDLFQHFCSLEVTLSGIGPSCVPALENRLGPNLSLLFLEPRHITAQGLLWQLNLLPEDSPLFGVVELYVLIMAGNVTHDELVVERPL